MNDGIKIETETITIKPTNPFTPIYFPRFIRVIEHFIRVDIFKQLTYLIDIWTIEEPQTLVSIHSIESEEELTKVLCEELTK